ncbi:uncharacterized protein LOC144139456 [Haemaphysalis longicornis]
MRKAVQHVSEFCNVSGAKVNRDKCSGAWLGDWDAKPTSFLDMQWSDQVGMYLGVCFDTTNLQNGQNTISLNGLAAKVRAWHGRTIPLGNRAFVCNTVFFPAVWYAAQVMPCLPADVNRVHRFFATFIWESRFERMRRSNLFLSLAKGGLGLVNVEVKLKVQRYLFFRRQNRPLMLNSFAKLGCGFLRDWLKDAGVGPRSRVLKFYRELEQAVRFFEERFSRDYLMEVKRKSLYWDTIDMLFPAPLYRSRMDSTLVSDVLKRLPRLPVKVAVKDFFIRFHVEVLPVKPWLANKGFFVPWSTNCDLCPYAESLQHVFLFCTNAAHFWHEVRSAFGISLYPTWKDVKFLTSEEFRDDKCVEIVLLLGLYAIWRSRTDHVLCLEGAKSAWTHFCDAFAYTSSLLKSADDELSSKWKVMEAQLHRRVHP